MAKKTGDSAPLETEIRKADPKSLKPRDKNARFMTAQQLERLVTNVKRDGRLTSLPLAHQRPDGVLEILSGHHRVQAAVKAGLTDIDVLVITSVLDADRLTAIQLSHNAITGQDDASILQSMFDGLDLDEKRYSGLGDDILSGVDKLDLVGLSLGTVAYEELRISFLPEDREEFEAFLKRIGKAAAKRPELVAHFDDFDRFFTTLIAVKSHTQIHNAGIALRFMAELAAERLDQLEQEHGEPEEGGAEEETDQAAA